MNTETTKTITAVYREESDLYAGRVLITVMWSDGTHTEKHLSGSVANRYIRSMRAKVA